MGLELYAKIEEHLDFHTEVQQLHSAFAKLVQERKPRTLIDIGCGQGAFLELFKTSDIKCLGLDLSQNQIAIAKQKNLNAVCCEVRDLSDCFDCATAIFDVLNYIHPQNLEQFCQDVSRVLNPQGFFVFDVNTKFAFEEIVEGAIVIDKNELFIAIDAYFKNNILSTNITVFEKNNTGRYDKNQETVTQYFHSKDSLMSALKKAGFSLKKTIAYNLHGYSQSDKTIYICQKNIHSERSK